ncbi:hypothetical protein KSP40_PGU010791 [Platanthera guangdongensis]|uniref:Uncharacterized protein n=1 Tax=Platanthera guangdongensis TaxID=2320717 RepID=A0ABR2LDC5_9ASPA
MWAGETGIAPTGADRTHPSHSRLPSPPLASSAGHPHVSLDAHHLESPPILQSGVAAAPRRAAPCTIPSHSRSPPPPPLVYH